MKRFLTILTALSLLFTSAPFTYAIEGLTLQSLYYPTEVKLNHDYQLKFTITNSSGTAQDLTYCGVWANHSVDQSTGSLIITSAQFKVDGAVFTPDSINGGASGVNSIIFYSGVSVPDGSSANAYVNVRASGEVSVGDIISYSLTCDIGSEILVTDYVNISVIETVVEKPVEEPVEKPVEQPKPAETLPPVEVKPIEEDIEIKSVKLPSKFMVEGSESTKLDELSEEELKTVKNLVLDIPNKNKIEFKGEFDLSTEEVIERLEDAVKIDQTAKVTVDSELMSELNVSAKVTMRGLDFKRTPKILKDGKDAGDEVTNVKYDSATGVLTFEVKGFSTYEAVSDDPNGPTQPKDMSEDGNSVLLIAGLVALGGGAIGGAAIYYFKRRKLKAKVA